MKKVIVLSLLALSLTLISAPANGAVRFGFGLGYGGRVFGPGPVWAGRSYWAPPIYYAVPARYANFGKLKVDTNDKDASVYINGAFAGTAGKLKTLSLRSGSYDIEIRSTNGGVFDEKVFVPIDKTILIEPVFNVASK